MGGGGVQCPLPPVVLSLATYVCQVYPVSSLLGSWPDTFLPFVSSRGEFNSKNKIAIFLFSLYGSNYM